MKTDVVSEASASQDDMNSTMVEAESSKFDLVVEMSSNEEMKTELKIADDILTRMELDLACASEKLVNLSVLMMHAATKENEFEATASMNEELLGDSLEALEFDLLSRILDFEVIEVDKFIRSAEENVFGTRQMISSYENLGKVVVGMEERLRDSEESLKQLHDQVSEIREQSARFQRTSCCLNRGENWNKGTNFSADDQFLDCETKVKMHTAEQQRLILRMLEKSLAREMDVEKKLTESRQIGKDLENRLLFMEQELFFVEEELLDACERWFRAENAAEVIMGTSKELLSKLKMIQCNLNGSIQQESELRLKLDKAIEQLGSKENALPNLNSSRKLNDLLLEQADNLKASLAEAEENSILSNNEALALGQNMNSLEKQLSNSKVSVDGSHNEHITEGVKEIGEGKDSNAKFTSKKLAGSSMELVEKMGQFEAMSERATSLEKQLAESDIKLQHAMASADASQEKENMLCTTIRDMEIVIEDLKSKALKAENRSDSMEDKCIILSESNEELNKELSFFRGRLESMEQEEERKISAAKNIDFRAKVIKDLVMQLAIERDHLHKQMVKLELENKSLVLKLRQKQKDPIGVNHNREYGEHLFLDDVTKKSATGSKVEKTQKDGSGCKTNAATAASVSVPEIVRRIDAGILSFKHILMAALILLISGAVYLFQPEQLRHGL